MRDASAVRAGTGRAGVGIVTVQVGVAVLLLAGTGAAVRSLLELYRAPLGFDQTHVTIAQLYLAEGHYAAWPERARFYERLRSEVAHVASVESSTLSLIPTATPPQVGGQTRIEAEGLGTDQGTTSSARNIRHPIVNVRTFAPRAATLAFAIGCGLLAAGDTYWPAAFGVFGVAARARLPSIDKT